MDEVETPVLRIRKGAPTAHVDLTSQSGVGLRLVQPSQSLVVSLGNVLRGPAGPVGPSGPAAQFTLVGSYACSKDVSAGQPAFLSRATGLVACADAASYLTSFVIGYFAQDCKAGLAVDVMRGECVLPDWTALTGKSTLTLGVPYFLQPGGGIGVAVPSAPASAAVAVIGIAASALGLIFQPQPPLML